MPWFKNIFNDLIRFFFQNPLYSIRYLRFCCSPRIRRPSFSFTCHFVYRISYSFVLLLSIVIKEPIHLRSAVLALSGMFALNWKTTILCSYDGDHRILIFRIF